MAVCDGLRVSGAVQVPQRPGRAVRVDPPDVGVVAEGGIRTIRNRPGDPMRAEVAEVSRSGRGRGELPRDGSRA